MEDARKILSMIEAVDPDDKEALDEIDLAVFRFITKSNATNFVVDYDGSLYWTDDDSFEVDVGGCFYLKDIQYTRSQDALKPIRPDGWEYMQTWHKPEGYSGKLVNRTTMVTIGEFGQDVCATEELAELHAIIQAIDYERTTTKEHNNGKTI